MTTTTARFRAVLETNGKTATGFEVPADVVEGFGRGRRVPVRVSIGPHTYRSTIAVMGGRFLLPVSAENRTAAGIAAGDELDVSLELDDAPRSVEVPDDLAEALAAEPEAKAFFDGLSFSQQRWHVEQVTGAKAADTRRRRVEKSLDLLRQGKAR